METQAVSTNEEEEAMKAIVSFIIAAMLVMGLTGCASTQGNMPDKVKCPQCGFEFDPTPGP